MLKFLNTPAGRKVEHLVVAFGATFGTTLAFNGEHVLAEHGLSAVKSAIPALLVTAALAGWQQVRGSLPKQVVVEVEKLVKRKTLKKTPPPTTPAA